MNVLLHTIALEPARWSAQRVSQSLTDLIPRIAARRKFSQLEIFEPHLTEVADENALSDLLKTHALLPVMLSSYLQIAPAKTSDDNFTSESAQLAERVRRFGFRKVRIFPGPGMSPDDREGSRVVIHRLQQIADETPQTEILLETHDGSLADDPNCICRVVEECERANIGLLFQPTIFQPEPTRRQFEIQRKFIRHVHLQNRHPDGSFASLKSGVITWSEILSHLDCDASIEFVPSGMRKFADFDLQESLAEAEQEAEFVAKMQRHPSV